MVNENESHILVEKSAIFLKNERGTIRKTDDPQVIERLEGLGWARVSAEEGQESFTHKAKIAEIIFGPASNTVDVPSDDAPPAVVPDEK
jgi:hypothetical protein